MYLLRYNLFKLLSIFYIWYAIFDTKRSKVIKTGKGENCTFFQDDKFFVEFCIREK